MNNKKLTKGLAAVALVASLGVVGGSLAWFTDTDLAENTFVTNHVDIKLDEPGYKDDQVVLPGATFVKNPRITLKEGSSNAKVVVTLSDKSVEVFDLEDFGLQYDVRNWKVSEDGAYIVCNNVLKAGDEVYPFGENAQVMIPHSFGNKYADATIKISFTAEAVQAENNEAGFEAQDLVIEQYVG